MNINILQVIWSHFLEIDKKGDGYILPKQVIEYIDERMYSIVSPYFMRLFDIMEKQEPDRVSFEEFLPGLVSFCLFSRDEIFGFVFHMLDENKDDDISKTDLFKFLFQFNEGYRVFPPNITRSVEIVKLTRGDQISIQQFAEMAQQVPYLIFPAIRLQKMMRIYFGGERLWN
jgi:Ca2+-binding EF-hand superfamily protein